MEVICQELLSTPKYVDKQYPKPPKPSPKFREHGKDVIPPYSVLNAEYILCLKGNNFDENKNKSRVKDNMQLPGPVARSLETSFVDTAKVVNYLDVFNLTARNISGQLQDLLKDTLPSVDLESSADEISISRQKLDTVHSTVMPLLDKLTQLSEANGEMLDRLFQFLAYGYAMHQLACRDASMLSLHGKVTQDVKQKLRLSPFAKQVLFDPEAVEKAKE